MTIPENVKTDKETEMDVLAQHLMIVYNVRTIFIYNHLLIHPPTAGQPARTVTTAVAIIMSAVSVLMIVTLDMVWAMTHDTTERQDTTNNDQQRRPIPV